MGGANAITAVLGGLTGGTVGFAASLLAEGAQRRVYGPKLELDHGAGANYVTRTDMFAQGSGTKIAEAMYVRIRVRNAKPRIAKSCRAYLTKVEIRKPDLKYEDTAFGESIQLPWAAQGDPVAMYRPLDIPKGINQFIDIIAVTNLGPQRPRPILAVPLSMHDRIWDFVGTYRFTILVSGDGVMPVSRKLLVTWNGIWSQITASDDGPGAI